MNALQVINGAKNPLKMRLPPGVGDPFRNQLCVFQERSHDGRACVHRSTRSEDEYDLTHNVWRMGAKVATLNLI
jgi:hypothetical protein